MIRSVFPRTILAAAGAAALAVAMVGGVANAEVPSDEVPSELKSAIQQEVESRGFEYAGFCRDIEQHEHQGEWCSFVLSMTPTTADVTFGPVASNDIHSATFTKQGDAWSVDDGPEDVDPDQVPADLQDAIQKEVEARGHTYAGLCRAIEQGEHLMEWCAFVLSLSANEARVSFGAVLSDEIEQAVFVKSAGVWSVRDSDSPAVTPTPEPPSTGTGTDASHDDGGYGVLAAGLVVAAVASLAIGPLAMRRR